MLTDQEKRRSPSNMPTGACSDAACSVFWVHADNETTFAQDYKRIAEELGVRDVDGEKLLAAVRGRIEAEPSWVLVLDNADDLGLFGVGQASVGASACTTLSRAARRGRCCGRAATRRLAASSDQSRRSTSLV